MVYQLIQSLLFPARCRLCGDPAHAASLCAPCHAELPWLGLHCRQCARPLAAVPDGVSCGSCQRRRPAFNRTRAALHYQPPVDYLVKRLKFGHELALGPVLATLFLHTLERDAALPELLLPVPLHPARLRTRGFNQAAELARLLGCSLDIPVRHLCRRTRDTSPQSQLPPSARRLNLRNAFALAKAPQVAHVAIVDDVMTSGQTAHELARVLKSGGVRTVDVWVVARAGQANPRPG